LKFPAGRRIDWYGSEQPNVVDVACEFANAGVAADMIDVVEYDGPRRKR